MTSCLNFYFVLSGEVIKLLNDRYKEQNRTEYLALIEEGYDFLSAFGITTASVPSATGLRSMPERPRPV